MNLVVNGENKIAKEGSSVNDLILSFSIKPEAVVVELNYTIISKDLWDKTILNENDNIEIVRFVGGG